MKYVYIISLFLASSATGISQNVGIGTETPAQKLDVSGNIRADTILPDALRLAVNAGIGKVLTSDDVGNANWEELSAPPPPDDNIGFGVWGDCETNGNITGYQPVADTAGIPNDFFGISVACSGDYAAIGANYDDETFIDQGSVSIYYFNGTSWDLIQKITDPDPGDNDHFGSSVAISGNFILVGSPGDDVDFTDQGSVCSFQLNGGIWEFHEKLTSFDGAAYDLYGVSVAISGDNCIIGANQDDVIYTSQGSAYIYSFNGVNWEFQLKVYDLFGSDYDAFGNSVGISGGTAIVGCRNDNLDYVSQGSISVYQYDGAFWSFQQKLTDPSPAAFDEFGASVSISGNEIISGVPKDDDVGENKGSAAIFRYNGNTWEFKCRLYNPEISTSEYFGSNVSISGGIAFVGSPYDQFTDIGSASLFRKVGTLYQRLQYIVDPAAEAYDLMGIRVCIDGASRHFMTGVPNHGTESGKVLFGRVK